MILFGCWFRFSATPLIRSLIFWRELQRLLRLLSQLLLISTVPPHPFISPIPVPVFPSPTPLSLHLSRIPLFSIHYPPLYLFLDTVFGRPGFIWVNWAELRQTQRSRRNSPPGRSDETSHCQNRRVQKGVIGEEETAWGIECGAWAWCGMIIWNKRRWNEKIPLESWSVCTAYFYNTNQYD